MQIDFVADISCPWSAIAFKSLLAALERLGPEANVELILQPFELHPEIEPEGRDFGAHMRQKYAIDDATLAADDALIREDGAKVGFHVDTAKCTRVFNSFDAHRLSLWAEVEGEKSASNGFAIALRDALFKAYFVDGADISSHQVLARLAATAGLDGAKALKVLQSDQFADEVDNRTLYFRERGVETVPTIIIDERELLEPGLSAEELDLALRDAQMAQA